MNAYQIAAICIVCFMPAMFLLSVLKKDMSLADCGWGLGFIIVALATFYTTGNFRNHQRIVTFLTVIWGARLSLYITARHWGKPEDFRYANWRSEWGNTVIWRSFLQVFVLQGFIMFVNLLPIMVVNDTENIYKGYKVLYPVGCFIWGFGFLFEAVGDWQMFMFKESHHQKRKVMNMGLWKYTRHPNYFGEVVMWWGIFLMAIPSGKWYISVWAPITITYLLLRVSGVTMLEKKYDGDDAYSQYKRNTSSFFPWFPKN